MVNLGLIGDFWGKNSDFFKTKISQTRTKNQKLNEFVKCFTESMQHSSSTLSNIS